MIRYKWVGEVDIKSIDKVDILREEMQDNFLFIYNDNEKGDVVFSVAGKNYKIGRQEIEESVDYELEENLFQYKDINISLNVKDDILFIDSKSTLSQNNLKNILSIWSLVLYYKVELEIFRKEIQACIEIFQKRVSL